MFALIDSLYGVTRNQLEEEGSLNLPEEELRARASEKAKSLLGSIGKEGLKNLEDSYLHIVSETSQERWVRLIFKFGTSNHALGLEHAIQYETQYAQHEGKRKPPPTVPLAANPLIEAMTIQMIYNNISDPLISLEYIFYAIAHSDSKRAHEAIVSLLRETPQKVVIGMPRIDHQADIIYSLMTAFRDYADNGLEIPHLLREDLIRVLDSLTSDDEFARLVRERKILKSTYGKLLATLITSSDRDLAMRASEVIKQESVTGRAYSQSELLSIIEDAFDYIDPRGDLTVFWETFFAVLGSDQITPKERNEALWNIAKKFENPKDFLPQFFWIVF